MAAKKMAIIATKGALDMAYPPLILASTAAALGWRCRCSSPSTACNCCARTERHRHQPAGQPGHAHARAHAGDRLGAAGHAGHGHLDDEGQDEEEGRGLLTELRDLCQEAEVKFIARQMTVDLFEFDKNDFIDGIEYGGAATFMKFAGETDVCLFI